jgi:uncharacterized repeat protein (TIGR01451 family)
MIANNEWVDTGAHVTADSNDNEIHENCFYDNEPQAMDNGTNNDWDGNYWSPPPGESGDHTIPGTAGSEGTNPLDKCPLISPLSLSKTDDVGDCVDPGDLITYTICYDNLQNPDADVHNVTINDTLPAGVTFDSASHGGTHTAGVVTWDIGTVQAEAPETCVTLNVMVNTGTEGQTLTNCARIESDETEPTTTCEDTQVCTAEPQTISVPTLTPIGILALIVAVGLVLVIGTTSIRRKED